MRVDAAIIDMKTRWIRAFEIKVDRADFVRDDKWMFYSRFCSSLSIACPANLIRPEEVSKPFGLLWVAMNGNYPVCQWAKRPRNFQLRNSLAWLWTYIGVIEREFPRLNSENERLRQEVEWLKKNR